MNDPIPTSAAPPRLVSLDAYRGFIMLAMASGGLGLAGLGKAYPDSDVARFVAFHADHVAWVGCAFWDLIQPSFMFMVGVALPFSYASRKAKGDGDAAIVLHAVWRSLLLILLGVFLTSNWEKPAWDPSTNWVFTNVLCQIGLGYPFLFLLRGRGLAVQTVALVGLLAGATVAFGLYPTAGPDWFSHWDKGANLGHAFDFWFLNQFPRDEPFFGSGGGYTTLNFVPSLATMLLGLMAGEMLLRERSISRQVLWLASAGLVCLGLGAAAAEAVVPLVKRLWTPSWALYSTGWTFLMLAGFHTIIEGAGWKAWAFPFVVVGMNSIAMYVMAQVTKPWVVHSLKVHFGIRAFAGPAGSILLNAAALFVLWLVCWRMYRRRLFLKI